MSIHEIHCNNCYSLYCQNQSCLVYKCYFCKVLLHECKTEDHLNEICRKVEINCPNHFYGCRKRLIREKIGIHLEKCSASIVVCNRDRGRKIVTKECKLELKNLGKQIRSMEEQNLEDLDLQVASHDQNMIVKSYNSSRKTRVRQRDPLNPAHPLIPLRKIAFDTSIVGPVGEDSSEDEILEKREKMKKSKLVFANCYMCQVDPSVQHLHTLGSGADMERARKRRVTPKEMDAFHRKYELKIDFTIETIPECSIKGQNIREIKKGGTIYTIKCLKSLRRLEWGQHNLFQHSLTLDQMETHIVRFDHHTSTVVYSPNVCTEPSKKAEYNLENLPLWVYEHLCTFLPSSSIYNLSMVSRLLRYNVFVACQSILMVEPMWRKMGENGNWKNIGFKWKFSSTEPLPCLKWTVPSSLSEHIGNCPYFNSVTYNKPRVEIFYPYSEEIWVRAGK